MSMRDRLNRIRKWFSKGSPTPTSTTLDAASTRHEKEAAVNGLQFLSDSAIGEDRFGRSHFSRALARALVLPPNSEGLVVGIEGTWGSGKTFVINQIKSVLHEGDDQPILVEFNPWVISGADSLVEALLEQISSAIGKEPDLERRDAAVKAGSSVLRYLSLVRHLKYLKYVPGVTALGHAAEDLPDLAEKIGKGASEGAEDLTKLAKEFPEHSPSLRGNVEGKNCATHPVPPISSVPVCSLLSKVYLP